MKEVTTEAILLEKLRDCITNCDTQGVQGACEDALNAGIQPYKAISNGLSKGMEIVGQKYENGEFFLAELLMAGETMKEAMKILGPHLTSGDVKSLGTVVLGTVKGDLHDLGKSLVKMLLEAAGFQVVDLGIDVPTEQFIEAIKDKNADILAMSALLTTSMPEMQTVIRKFEAELRRKIKIIIGGAPITSEYGAEIGADAVGKDAIDGVNICKEWRKEVETPP